MNRRDLLIVAAGAGGNALLAAAPLAGATQPPGHEPARHVPAPAPLSPPPDADIPVAFLISDGAVVIDFAGPWEVFSDVAVPGRRLRHPFRLYTVSETASPVRADGGMVLIPNHTIASAPRPKVLVVPAQADPSPAVIGWIRDVTREADVTMSVCTGAFVLARAGLLAGKPATTHHGAYADFAAAFPDVAVVRGARFVEFGNVATSGGLSSGIDLALHVVARYFGDDVAARTADTMEYQGTGWRDPGANQAYAARRMSTDRHPLCAVCDMDVDASSAPASIYKGRRFLFCSGAHKVLFDAAPERYAG